MKMNHSTWTRITTLCFLAVLSGCADTEMAKGRGNVKAQLRDPDSAQFRNEKIRVLWSKEGSRLKLYCAEVNARNAFGGMTGYSDAEHVIEASLKDETSESIWKTGSTFVSRGITANHEWYCDRPDTERDGKSFGNLIAAYDSSPAGIKAEMDVIPILSDEIAPELR
jgi:hypothetical protein